VNHLPRPDMQSLLVKRSTRLIKHHYATMSMLLKRLTSENVVVNGRKVEVGEVYLICNLTSSSNILALKRNQNKQTASQVRNHFALFNVVELDVEQPRLRP